MRSPFSVHPSYFHRCTDGLEFRGESCFEIVKDEKSFTAAVEHCQEAGGQLALIQSERESKYVGDAVLQSMVTFNHLRSVMDR